MKVARTSTYDSTLDPLVSKGKGFFDVALVDLSVDNSYTIFEKFLTFDPSIKVILMSRFGATISAHLLRNQCTVSFVRPAPRKRYVSAVHDALNPQARKLEMTTKKPERELLKALATRHPLNILLAEDNPLNMVGDTFNRHLFDHIFNPGFSPPPPHLN
jgi:osomolarity two-component system sensor histidine kinase CHK1